jgi:hypothetical protein
MIPVFNRLVPNVYDDINYKSCLYAKENKKDVTSREDYYYPFYWELPKMKYKMGHAFHYTY